VIRAVEIKSWIVCSSAVKMKRERESELPPELDAPPIATKRVALFEGGEQELETAYALHHQAVQAHLVDFENEQIRNAAAEGNMELMERWLRGRGGTAADPATGMTPLMLAVANNHPRVVRTLIERWFGPQKDDVRFYRSDKWNEPGNPVNARNFKGQTALMMAPHEYRIMRWLQKFADPHIADNQGNTALMHAVIVIGEIACDTSTYLKPETTTVCLLSISL
jgi:hypothetical protein